MANEDSDEDLVILMVTTCDDNTTQEEWYLNTRCSNHMTWPKDWLTDIDLSKKTMVRLADDKSLKEGIGNVLIHTKNGKTAVIENVLYDA